MTTTIPKWLLIALLMVSFAGFLDASYLTAKHYLGTPINCSIFEGCNEVASSPYAVMAGLPVALYGVLYYLAIFLGVIAALDFGGNKLFRILANLTVVGFLASVYFTYLQGFVIGAWCLYCLVSAATSTMLFALGFPLRRAVRAGA